MNKSIGLVVLFVLSAAVVASGAPVLVGFENPSDMNLFANPAGASWSQAAGHGGNVVSAISGTTWYTFPYSPGGAAYPVGAGTISADVDLVYGGVGGRSTYQGGLLLQERSADETYSVMLKATQAGTPAMVIGNWAASGYPNAQFNHSSAVSLPLTYDTFTAGSSVLDLGWFHITAVVGTDASSNYKVDVTLTGPSGHVYALTYVDSGTDKYTDPYPVGLIASSAVSQPVYFDNFQITPEPASLALLAFGGLLGLRRRGN